MMSPMRNRLRGNPSRGAVAWLLVLSVPTCAVMAGDSPGRCGPKFLFAERGGETLLVLCQKDGSLLRLEIASGNVTARGDVCAGPFTLSAHPDGSRLYVSCRRGQEIRELDAVTLETIRGFPLVGDPTGLAVSSDGRRLFAAVHSLDQVAVIDLHSGDELKRLAAGNGPEFVRRSPHDGRVYVTNLLPNPAPVDRPPLNEITVINEFTGHVVDRVILENANVGRWIDFSPDGRWGIAAIARPKNLVPMVQVARGWVVTNGLAILAAGNASPVQLLIDLPNQAYADAYAVAFTPDGDRLYVTSAGLDTLIAVDMARLGKVVDEVRAGKIPRAADHLGLSRRYVAARIPVGANPESLALGRDGAALYVGNRLDDSITVVDTATGRVQRTIVIEDPAPPDYLHRGEHLFHSAARTFQGQFACTGCHPDGGLDGLQYDMEPDGLGEDIIDNRNMRGVVDTGPFKWVGTNPDIATQCGMRTAKWIVRTGWLSAVEVVELTGYIHSIEEVVNPYRRADGSLTAAQRRGKALFERTVDNHGNPIPKRNRCDFCHTGPKFTDGRQFDVGTKGPRDRKAQFDTAHLNNVFESAPYLHDGRAATLEEIWTKYNPEDRHGLSSDWNKQQLNDLVEYLKSL